MSVSLELGRGMKEEGNNNAISSSKSQDIF